LSINSHVVSPPPGNGQSSIKLSIILIANFSPIKNHGGYAVFCFFPVLGTRFFCVFALSVFHLASEVNLSRATDEFVSGIWWC